MRRHEDIAADLRWFLRDSDGELGLRSNFNGIVARIEGGSRGEVHHIDFRAIEAATRARRISKVLLGLRNRDVAVLRAAYTEGDTVMRLMPEAVELHRKSRSTRTLVDWLERLKAQAKDDFERRRLFVRIHAAADIALRGALDAYAKHQGGLLSQGAR